MHEIREENGGERKQLKVFLNKARKRINSIKHKKNCFKCAECVELSFFFFFF